MKDPRLTQFEDLLGETITEVRNNDGSELVFTLASGETCKLYHRHDCCESVSIEDINGDLDDLLNSPVTVAVEDSNGEDPPGWKKPEYAQSHTWTFYRIGTLKGVVVIRWYGESNGYYSEAVDFRQTS